MSWKDVNDAINQTIGGMMNLFFPRKCPFCGAITGKQLLCDSCRRDLPWCDEERTVGSLRVTAPLYYEDGVRKAVHDLKFRSMTGGLDCFGQLMAQCAAERYSGEFDAVTWVPVSHKRLKKRGFDQSRLLAASLCVDWHVMPLETLEKTVDNPPQSGIDDGDERRANVLGVYRVVNADAFAGKRLLLIDDVCTTGATLSECARVLKSAGAADVVALTLSMVRDGR
ncbi:MAG: ComF family protein [Oscillospiraceae bacterium]|nr:ComF family protein [Oscillospiraceae bacterium]